MRQSGKRESMAGATSFRMYRCRCICLLILLRAAGSFFIPGSYRPRLNSARKSRSAFSPVVVRVTEGGEDAAQGSEGASKEGVPSEEELNATENFYSELEFRGQVPDGIREPTGEELSATDNFFSEIKARYKGETVEEILGDRALYKQLKDKIGDNRLEAELKVALADRIGGLATGAGGNTTDILPKPERTPEDVVMLILNNLRSNDEPYKDHGIEVFYRFTSESSVTFDYDIERVADYIKSSKYSVLTRWDAVNFPRQIDISMDKKKAHQMLKLRDPLDNTWNVVSFMLSFHKNCWLVDSVIVRAK